MRILRWVLAALIAAYAVFSLYPQLMTLGWRLGWLHAVSPDEARTIPLMQAMSWWQLAVWFVAVLLLMAVAWRLARGQPATRWFVAAFVVDVGGWLSMSTMPVYRQVFTPAERQFDYWIIGALAAVGVGIVLVERRGRAALQPSGA
jgi:hypothetical protein